MVWIFHRLIVTSFSEAGKCILPYFFQGFSRSRGRIYPHKVTKSQKKDQPKNFTNSIGMKFVWIPPGNFMMGSPKEEKARKKEENQHKVTLTKGFYMGVF